MKTSKSTILVGILLVALCLAVCVGTTYAFFTAVIKSTDNTIQSGNLSVELKLLDQEDKNNWITLTEESGSLFNSGTWAANETDVKIIKVENVGELALKWQAKLKTEGLSAVADDINVYVKVSTEAIAYSEDYTSWTDFEGTLTEFMIALSQTLGGELDKNSDAYYVGIALCAKESISYPTLELGRFDITIQTLQKSYESDFFDNTYDANLTFNTCSHENVAKTDGVDATCTVAGYTASKTCSDCGQVFVAQAVLPTNGSHTEVVDAAVAATCTTTGLTEGKHCSVCGEVLVAQTTVDKLGHTAGTAVVENNVDPVLNANGTVTDGSYESVVYCSVCGAELSRKTVTVTASELTVTADNRSLVGYTDTTTDLSIPDFFQATDGNWYKVTAIDSSAFSGCTTLTNVSIPDTVTSIGDDAFRNCTSLESVSFGENSQLVSFGTDYTFAGCSSLMSIEIPKGITKIPYGAFSNCSGLTTVTFAEGSNLTTIAQQAFYNCSSLESIALPDGLTTIGIEAFYVPNPEGGTGTNQLTSIKIPGSVTSIGDRAFLNSTKLTSVTFGEDSKLTTIGLGAFRACSSLTSFDIPDGVTSIGGAAFYGCKSLESIVIPDGVTDILTSTFYYCLKLSSVKIPDSVTNIGDYAFGRCLALTSITIPASVTIIDDYAFGYCFALTNITYGGTITQWNDISIVTTWNESAPATHVYCAADGKYVHLKTVAAETGAAATCTTAQNCTVCGFVLTPASGHTEVVDAAVAATCTTTGLTEGKHCSVCNIVIVAQTVVDALGHDWVQTAIDANSNPIVITYTCSRCGDTYTESQTATTYTLVADDLAYFGYDSTAAEQSFEIPAAFERDGVWYRTTAIGVNAFNGLTNLTSVTIPDTVTSIGSGAFKNCSSLTSIDIPVGVSELGSQTFNGCTALTSVTIPDTVTDIYDYAFSDCTGLNAVYITDMSAWCNINFWNFSYDDPLYYAGNLYLNGELVTNLVIPDDVTTISKNAFSGCTSITEITFGSNVEVIGNGAFRYCTGLTSVIIPDTVTEIDGYAFYYCTNLTDVTIGSGVTRLRINAFLKCTALTRAIFQEPDGWWYASSSNATSGKSISSSTLSDPTAAANKLVSNSSGGNCASYWGRTASDTES